MSELSLRLERVPEVVHSRRESIAPPKRVWFELRLLWLCLLSLRGDTICDCTFRLT